MDSGVEIRAGNELDDGVFHISQRTVNVEADQFAGLLDVVGQQGVQQAVMLIASAIEAVKLFKVDFSEGKQAFVDGF